MMLPANNHASQNSQSPFWYGEQDANGVDLSLIRENLKLTFEQRLANLEGLQEFAIEIRRAMIESNQVGRRDEIPGTDKHAVAS